MTEITVGTWFAYQYTITESGRSRSDPKIIKYTVKSIDGDKVTMGKEVNGDDAGDFTTDKSHGSYVFDMSTLSKRGSENMTTSFGHMYVSIYEFNGDGCSERVFLGKDNVVFRDIRTKRKSEGVLVTETRELCWSSMKLRFSIFILSVRGTFSAGCAFFRLT